jgi:hypothetical protein
MARWNAVVRLPDFPDRVTAERYANAEFSLSLVGVYAVAAEEIAAEQRRVIERERRKRREADDGA